MASLKEKIEENAKKALIGKREIEVSVLRMLKAAVLNREKEKRYKISKENPGLDKEKLDKESQFNDEEVIDTISSEIKKRKDAFILFEKGKREDLAQKEKAEIEILQKYLPEQISEDDLKKLAQEIIAETKAQSIKDMGKVISGMMSKVKGRAERGTISRIVKEMLAAK